MIHVWYNSMRGDEGTNSWSLLATKMEARAVEGRGEKSLRRDPRFELRLREGEGEIKETKRYIQIAPLGRRGQPYSLVSYKYVDGKCRNVEMSQMFD